MASNGETSQAKASELSLPVRAAVNDTADLKTIPDFKHPFLSKKSALLVVDIQNDLVSACHGTDIGSVLHSVEGIVEFARQSCLDIIFTRFIGDAKYLGPAWQHRDRKYARDLHCFEGTQGADIHHRVEPRPNERVFDKKGVFDPFLVPEFDNFIADLGIEHLLLAGLYSDLGVDAAARSAFQRGLFVTVVDDATAPFYPKNWAPDGQQMAEAYGARVVTCDQLTRMSVETSRGTNLGKPKDSSTWFRPEIGPRLADSTRHVFKIWSNLEGEKLEKHLQDIRQKAWQLFEYPCIGQWMFLLPSLSRLPWFADVVEGLKHGPNSDGFIIDMGTFLGQDLRLLATHGISTHRMRGLDRDIRPWGLGFDLFLDHKKFEGLFIHMDFLKDAESEARMYGLPWQDHITSMTLFTANKDVLRSRSGGSSHADFNDQCLKPFNQRCSVIIASQFIHLFSLPQQTVACIRITKLSRLGTIVIGYQGGRKSASTSKRPWGTMFHHSPETWRDMWRVVQMVTGTEWRIDVRGISFEGWGLPKEDFAWMAEDEMGLDFFCERIK